MVQQPFNEVFVKVGEFVAMMLINIAQNTLGAVLLQLRQRIELNQLAQLLRHRFTFDHKMVNKPGAIGESERF